METDAPHESVPCLDPRFSTPAPSSLTVTTKFSPKEYEVVVLSSAGEKVITMVNKTWSLKPTLHFYDSDGKELYSITRTMRLSAWHIFNAKTPDGKSLLTIKTKRAMFQGRKMTATFDNAADGSMVEWLAQTPNMREKSLAVTYQDKEIVQVERRKKSSRTGEAGLKGWYANEFVIEAAANVDISIISAMVAVWEYSYQNQE